MISKEKDRDEDDLFQDQEESFFDAVTDTVNLLGDDDSEESNRLDEMEEEDDFHLKDEEDEENDLDHDKESKQDEDWEDYSDDDERYVHSLCSKTVAGYYKDEEELDFGYSLSGWEIDDIEETLKDYLKFFSKEERDFIYLNIILGKSQVELAEFFGKTQPALCNDSNRIKKEIKIIMNLKDQSQKVLQFLIKDGTGLNYFTREILLVFYNSMSVTKTARIMGLNSMLCRARIEEAIEKLKELGWDEIYSYFQYILENLNKIKRNVSDELTSSQTVSKCDYTDGHLLQEFDFDD